MEASWAWIRPPVDRPERQVVRCGIALTSTSRVCARPRLLFKGRARRQFMHKSWGVRNWDSTTGVCRQAGIQRRGGPEREPLCQKTPRHGPGHNFPQPSDGPGQSSSFPAGLCAPPSGQTSIRARLPRSLLTPEILCHDPFRRADSRLGERVASANGRAGQIEPFRCQLWRGFGRLSPSVSPAPPGSHHSRRRAAPRSGGPDGPRRGFRTRFPSPGLWRAGS